MPVCINHMLVLATTSIQQTSHSHRLVLRRFFCLLVFLVQFYSFAFSPNALLSSLHLRLVAHYSYSSSSSASSLYSSGSSSSSRRLFATDVETAHLSAALGLHPAALPLAIQTLTSGSCPRTLANLSNFESLTYPIATSQKEVQLECFLNPSSRKASMGLAKCGP